MSWAPDVLRLMAARSASKQRARRSKISVPAFGQFGLGAQFRTAATLEELLDQGFLQEMDEVSAGVYEVIGRDNAGHAISAKGVDLDSLLEQCRKEARKISMRGPKQGP